jgi:hypothetical protein
MRSKKQTKKRSSSPSAFPSSLPARRSESTEISPTVLNARNAYISLGVDVFPFRFFSIDSLEIVFAPPTGPRYIDERGRSRFNAKLVLVRVQKDTSGR